MILLHVKFNKNFQNFIKLLLFVKLLLVDLNFFSCFKPHFDKFLKFNQALFSTVNLFHFSKEQFIKVQFMVDLIMGPVTP